MRSLLKTAWGDVSAALGILRSDPLPNCHTSPVNQTIFLGLGFPTCNVKFGLELWGDYLGAIWLYFLSTYYMTVLSHLI